jgi:predicted ATP-dependent serine protease
MTDLNKRTDLLEREADLEQIGGALRSAAAGSGGIVVIEGAPGIGKTSLLEEAAELAEAGRMSILRGRGGGDGERICARGGDPAAGADHRAAHGPRP